jgi:pyridoxamine 5'-phosphate oxidase
VLESDLDPDPVAQFGAWFAEAMERGAQQPEAIALATATPDGVPSVRMVLLKGWGQSGFRFFTNSESQKGLELAANPAAAAVVYWRELGRQVRVSGRVTPTGRAETEEYFHSRPTQSQVAAAISPQSRVVPSREYLDSVFRDELGRYPEGPVPLPDTWSGYRLEPDAIEFWEHQDHRLHDRIRYKRTNAGWTRERLGP